MFVKIGPVRTKKNTETHRNEICENLADYWRYKSWIVFKNQVVREPNLFRFKRAGRSSSLLNNFTSWYDLTWPITDGCRQWRIRSRFMEYDRDQPLVRHYLFSIWQTLKVSFFVMVYCRISTVTSSNYKTVDTLKIAQFSHTSWTSAVITSINRWHPTVSNWMKIRRTSCGVQRNADWRKSILHRQIWP